MSESPSGPTTRRITITISEDGKVHARPWMKRVNRGDSVVWSFRGLEPGKKPVVIFEPTMPGNSEAFGEVAVLASKFQGQDARGGRFTCQYGLESALGIEILELVSHRRTPGIEVMPPPPDAPRHS